MLPIVRRLFGLLAYLPMLKRTVNTFRGQKNSHTEQQADSTNTSALLTINEAYAILGLEPGASKQDIIQAHKQLMQRVHPDRGGSSHLAIKINQAKDLLLKSIDK
jgi:DnaJ-class molecular chaperone